MRILQVFRAPVGGLFRHVFDLVKAQSELGHEVGVVCDSNSGGSAAEKRLEELAPFCKLRINRIKMSRLPGLGDAIAAKRVAGLCQDIGFDIVHGHGAKGGVYARLGAKKSNAKSIYTAHGGSLHYSWGSLSGILFLSVERLLLSITDGLIFVCDYERMAFNKKLGIGSVANKVVHNGLWPNEFSPTKLTDDATDVLFVGELRKLKGVDVLIEAIAQHQTVTATIVGDGPDRADFEALSEKFQLTKRIKFTGAMPALRAFPLGRLMVIPSRAESFPYIVLEAMAAEKPLIASNVGGIGEILAPERMVPADDIDALSTEIGHYMRDPLSAEKAAKRYAKRLKKHKNTSKMASEICAFYQNCLESSRSCNKKA